MNGIKYFIKNNFAVIIAIFLFLIIELPFLHTSRPIMIDEAYYSNPSKNFVEYCNFQNTNIGFGGNGSMTYSFYLSVYFYFFGASIFIARMSSLILGIISLIILDGMLKHFVIRNSSRMIALLFFVSSNIYLSIFKYARPEALTLTLCLILLSILYRYINNGLHIKHLSIILFLTFLITNSHPFGSIIIGLSCLVILYWIFKKKIYRKIYQPTLILIVYFLSLVLVIYFLAASNGITFADSLSFVRARSAFASFCNEFMSKIKVTTEFYLTSARIVTFLPHMILIFLGLFFYDKNKSFFISSLLGALTLLIAYLTLSSGMFSYIYIYTFIFSVFALSFLLDYTSENKKLFGAVSTFIILIILVNLAAYGVLTYQTFDPDIDKKMNRINNIIPPKSEVITNAMFWFISPYKDFREWRYFNRNPEQLKDKNFYVITFENGKNEDRRLVNSILTEGCRNVDTLMTTWSKIYGRIDVIELKTKENQGTTN